MTDIELVVVCGVAKQVRQYRVARQKQKEKKKQSRNNLIQPSNLKFDINVLLDEMCFAESQQSRGNSDRSFALGVFL